MMNEVASLSDRIRDLRRARGLSQVVLAKRMGMTPSQLCKIERGCNRLSESSIRRLAGALGVSVATLLGESEGVAVSLSVVSQVQSVDSGELRRVLADELPRELVAKIAKAACEYHAKVCAVKAKLGVMLQSSVQLVYPYGVDEESSELLARDMRHALGLGCAPIANLETVLEMRGVRIVRGKFPSQFQSGSFYDLKARVLLIVLNQSNTSERNVYRLAYELGAATVFAMGGFETIRDEGAVHRLLRRFTAAFLMPEETVRMDVAQSGIAPDAWTMKLLVMMKSHFAVSAESYALRLESLGLIDPELRVKFRDELREYYRKHPKAMEPRASQGTIIGAMVK